MDFTVHTKDSAPSAAKPLLESSEAKYKFVPNLHGVMAESPELLESYQVLSGLWTKTSLSVVERQIVMLTINYENGCHYCMAAHSTLATMEKMPADILAALRGGTPIADTRLETLRAFTRTMVEKRGWVDGGDLQALLDAGYTKQTVFEVILALGYKVMSNYTNHIAATPVDPAFAAQTWTKPFKDAAE